MGWNGGGGNEVGKGGRGRVCVGLKGRGEGCGFTVGREPGGLEEEGGIRWGWGNEVEGGGNGWLEGERRGRD